MIRAKINEAPMLLRKVFICVTADFSFLPAKKAHATPANKSSGIMIIKAENVVWIEGIFFCRTVLLSVTRSYAV